MAEAMTPEQERQYLNKACLDKLTSRDKPDRQLAVEAIEDYLFVLCRERGLPDPQRSQSYGPDGIGVKENQVLATVFGVPVYANDFKGETDVRQIIADRYLAKHAPPPPPSTKLAFFLSLFVGEENSPLFTKLAKVFAEQQAGDGLMVATPKYHFALVPGVWQSEVALAQNLRRALADMVSEIDRALVAPGSLTAWLTRLSPGTLVLPPRFVKAEIVTCGFSGHTVEVVIDMSRVVAVKVHDEQVLDGQPPVELIFRDDSTQRVCGKPELWHKRYADAQTYLGKERTL